MLMTARQVMADWTPAALEATSRGYAATRRKTWEDAARTYGLQAQEVREGRRWAGDPERGKAARWVAVIFARMANLARAMEALELEARQAGVMAPWPDCPTCRGQGFVMATTVPFEPPHRFTCQCPRRPS